MSVYIRLCFILVCILDSYYSVAQKINITSQPSTIYQCLNNKVIFQVSTDLSLVINIQWYKNNIYLNSQNSNALIINNATNLDTGIYFAKIWTLTDTVYSDSAKLIITPKPVITLQPQNTNVCYKTASKIKINASGSVVLSYQWYKNGLKIIGQTKDSLYFGETNYSDTAYYHVLIKGLCDSTISNIVKLNIFPNQQPNLPNISNLCIKSNALEVLHFKDYLWSNGETTSKIFANMNGKYWVKTTDTNNCISFDTTMVILNSLANIYAGKDTIICNILELKLNANYINADSVIWQNNPYGSFNNKYSSNAIFTPNSLYSGNYDIIILAKNKCGITSDTLNLTLAPVPDSNFNVSDSIICLNSIPVKLMPKEIGGIFYGENVFNNQFNPIKSGIFYIKYQISKNYCSSLSSKKIEVKVAPNPSFSISPYNPIIDENVVFSSKNEANTSYSWYIGNAALGSSHELTKNFETSGNYQIKLLASNSFCKDTLLQNLIISESKYLYVPNAFSPNNDGINDEFKVVYKNSYETRLNIYNTWGELVFSSDNKLLGWDGNYNGNNCPIGLYIYIIEYKDYDNINRKIQGVLNLMR
jgi:gliding motility-associated-like protein